MPHLDEKIKDRDEAIKAAREAELKAAAKQRKKG